MQLENQIENPATSKGLRTGLEDDDSYHAGLLHGLHTSDKLLVKGKEDLAT